MSQVIVGLAVTFGVPCYYILYIHTRYLDLPVISTGRRVIMTVCTWTNHISTTVRRGDKRRIGQAALDASDDCDLRDRDRAASSLISDIWWWEMEIRAQP